MYEKFTDRARKVMQLACEEAQNFNHEYIGTEHILLGLVREGSGVAANVVLNLGIDLNTIRREVEKIVMPGPEMVTMGRLPQKPRSKKVFEFAIEEAHALDHNYIGTEHLLLGLVREHEGVAAQVLLNLGLKLEVVREEVLNLLGHAHGSAEFANSIPASWPDGEELPNLVAQHLPESGREIVAEFDCQIDVIKEEKEQAVGEQAWEKAAERRDLEYKLRKLRDEFLSHWPKP